MHETTFEMEKNSLKKGYFFVIGVDEAGRGPLAGPVVACAAAYRNQTIFSLSKVLEKQMRFVRDSKTLSEKKRERVFDFICENFFVGIGKVFPETIDRMNILEATFLAMKEAVTDLRRHVTGDRDKTLLLVDGNMTIPNLSLSQEAIIDGDALVRSIAAASIVAKVTRDRMMLEYDRQYPLYGFAKHKGYGTKAHMDALRKYGPCPIHRMSFKPVREATVEGINKQFLQKKY